MIIKNKILKEVCNKLLYAVDSDDMSVITETLSLKVINEYLYLSVTNREYFVKIKIPAPGINNFNATVNANIFLKLINQITVDDVELLIEENCLVINGNGKYKLPMIFDGDKLLNLPEITIINKTLNFNISIDILKNIYTYNSKEFNKGIVSLPSQKMYYIDNKGCITFTTGACVTNFSLPNDIKILLPPKIVKLFKLFTDNEINFSLGYDIADDGVSILPKASFSTNDIEIVSILCNDDSIINSVPVEAIRKRANEIYPHTIVLNKHELLQTINRLMLFTNKSISNKSYAIMDFFNEEVIIYDKDKENNETIKYQNKVKTLDNNYTLIVDLNDLKLVVETIKDEFITICFGNNQAIVIQRQNICNIIPECNI